MSLVQFLLKACVRRLVLLAVAPLLLISNASALMGATASTHAGNHAWCQQRCSPPLALASALAASLSWRLFRNSSRQREGIMCSILTCSLFLITRLPTYGRSRRQAMDRLTRPDPAKLTPQAHLRRIIAHARHNCDDNGILRGDLRVFYRRTLMLNTVGRQTAIEAPSYIQHGCTVWEHHTNGIAKN